MLKNTLIYCKKDKLNLLLFTMIQILKFHQNMIERSFIGINLCYKVIEYN